jgi:osomolarity two-component system response regulator SKN7
MYNGLPPPAGLSMPLPPPTPTGHPGPSFSPMGQTTLGILPSRPLTNGQKPKPAPAWSIRPRVLLVEDDPVCRQLSSKFLEVFGCTIDVAEDGMSAVSKMNAEKYDLVFMVR